MSNILGKSSQHHETLDELNMQFKNKILIPRIVIKDNKGVVQSAFITKFSLLGIHLVILDSYLGLDDPILVSSHSQN